MTPADLYRSALEDAMAYLRRAASGPRKTITLSPEVSALLEAITPVAGAATPAADTGDSAVSAATSGDAAAALAALAETVRGCEKCGLCKTRTQTVFGVGNINADLVFVGEAPGADEDRQGEPFVGQAGQLLTDIIVKGMKMRREDVYICNVLKCRPPGNRTPDPEEMALCEPYLIEQLNQIRPRVICALGATAAHCLLKTEENVGRLRGRWHTYQGVPLRVTYHPAYLLRKPEDKRKTWDDIQEVMKLLAGDAPPPV